MKPYYNCPTSCHIFPNLNLTPIKTRPTKDEHVTIAFHFSGTALPLTLDTATGTTRSSSEDLEDL